MENNEIQDLVHQLRTPLTSILGFAEFLLEDVSITEKQREYLEIIRQESIKMSELITATAANAEAADG